MKRLLIVLLPVITCIIILAHRNDRSRPIDRETKQNTHTTGTGTSGGSTKNQRHAQTQRIPDQGLARLTLLQIEIGRGALHADISQNVYRSVKTLSMLQDVIGTNVIAQLQEHTDDAERLDTYITSLQRVHTQASMLHRERDRYAKNQLRLYEDCERTKQNNDERFFDAIDTLDPKNAAIGYNISHEAALCMENHRVDISVAETFITQLTYFIELADAKYLLLTTHRDVFIDANELFADTVLEELMEIRDSARTFTVSD